VIFLLLFSIIGNCQEIPKDSNLVILESDSIKDSELFMNCIKILKSEGYIFDQIEKDFLMCSTKPIKPKGKYVLCKLEISVEENRLKIRSLVALPSHEYQPTQPGKGGANRSLKTSIWRYGWGSANRIE
jgi:hypothetical protein